MDIRLNGLIVIVGNYGSGKTEVSINLAVNRKQAGLSVGIADLDLVNPYFRTREARTTLTDFGIQVILPPEPYLHADLPVLSPTIAGMIRDSGEVMILDVGGNDVGSTVLAALADAFRGKKVHMLQVVNPLRPQTNTVSGCLRLRDEIETAAHLTITGLVGNANLIDETSVQDIYRGYEFVQSVARESGLPLAFITVSQELLPQIDMKRFDCAVLPIARQLVPPWMKVSEFRI
ncbi:MAG: cobalamin biosynthesis protein CbiA [Desulfobacterales bacterium]